MPRGRLTRRCFDNATRGWLPQHPQFNRAIDELTGLKTNSLLCVPLKRGDTVVGVAEFINKLNASVRPAWTPQASPVAGILSFFRQAH